MRRLPGVAGRFPTGNAETSYAPPSPWSPCDWHLNVRRTGDDRIPMVRAVLCRSPSPGFSMMNRFFSKLDLRDIRIDPKSSRFPPEGDDSGETVERDEIIKGNDREHAAVDDRPVAERSPKDGNDGEADQFLPAEWKPDTAAEPAMHVVPRMAPPGQPADIVTEDVLKVSARSRPSAVAGAIAGVVRDAGRAEVQAIGAGATNQAVKAVAIARDYLQENGIDVVCLPAFIDVTVANEDRTAIRLVIEPR